ncbi:hypothetical protein GEMRC1_003193 [Eukaryota sp. GEM-RC1]
MFIHLFSSLLFSDLLSNIQWRSSKFDPKHFLPITTSTASLFTEKTLVLDLDETLVHSSPRRNSPNHDFAFRFLHDDGTYRQAYVNKRPFVDEFLISMSQLFEIVVFTAASASYADPLISILDRHRCVSHRLYRDSCILTKKCLVKDLDLLGRDLNHVVIIDNSPCSYIFHEANAIPINDFTVSKLDKSLCKLIPVMEKIAASDSVPEILRHYKWNTFFKRCTPRKTNGCVVKFVHSNSINCSDATNSENIATPHVYCTKVLDDEPLLDKLDDDPQILDLPSIYPINKL